MFNKKLNKSETKKERTERVKHTDLAVLVGVFLHPHPGQVDLRETDCQQETFWTHDLSGQHADHCFTVSSLWDHEQKKAYVLDSQVMTTLKLSIIFFIIKL